MKIARILFLIAVLALVALPTLAQDAPTGNVLVMARAVDATGLDVHTQTAFASFRLLELIYEPLVELDPQLNVIPGLAESWEFSDDGLTLTFHLRQGVKFHDGSDFTSADVVATFNRILDEATGASARSNYTSIASIDAPDDFTVVFNLSQPDVPLLAAMATTNAGIAPSELVESGDFASTAIGTGPFKLESWTPDQTTVLSANTDWWGDGPNVDGIEIRIIPDETSILAALRAGTIDFAQLNDPLVATLLTDDANVQLERTPTLAYNVLQLRAERTPLDKLEVRQAISCAIDRQEVLDSAALGEGQVTGPVTSPAFALPNDELFCYTKDLDKARQLMEQAGLSEGFTLPMMAANAEPPTALSEAQSIQSQLADINITVEIEPLELGVYVDRWLAGDFDSAVALNSGFPDPFQTYVRYWMENSQFRNVAGYFDQTLNDLMAQGRAESDPDARYQIFADLQRRLTEESPWIWLYTGYSYAAHQPNVTGYVGYPTGSLISLAQVSIDRSA
ncbi:MAG: ABC transporter substrate-binding protein [Anaerolineae bacterium]